MVPYAPYIQLEFVLEFIHHPGTLRFHSPFHRPFHLPDKGLIHYIGFCFHCIAVYIALAFQCYMKINVSGIVSPNLHPPLQFRQFKGYRYSVYFNRDNAFPRHVVHPLNRPDFKLPQPRPELLVFYKAAPGDIEFLFCHHHPGQYRAAGFTNAGYDLSKVLGVKPPGLSLPEYFFYVCSHDGFHQRLYEKGILRLSLNHSYANIPGYLMFPFQLIQRLHKKFFILNKGLPQQYSLYMAKENITVKPGIELPYRFVYIGPHRGHGKLGILRHNGPLPLQKPHVGEYNAYHHTVPGAFPRLLSPFFLLLRTGFLPDLDILAGFKLVNGQSKHEQPFVYFYPVPAPGCREHDACCKGQANRPF